MGRHSGQGGWSDAARTLATSEEFVCQEVHEERKQTEELRRMMRGGGLVALLASVGRSLGASLELK